MTENVFGLSATFYPRQSCWPDGPQIIRFDDDPRPGIRVEDLPKEARVKIRRPDGNRYLMLFHDHPWLRKENESDLKIHVEALGGVWSAAETARLRRVLEPMIPHESRHR